MPGDRSPKWRNKSQRCICDDHFKSMKHVQSEERRGNGTARHQDVFYSSTNYSKETFVLGLSNEQLCELEENSLLVDCGATAHCLNDPSQFITFDKTFNPEEHYVKLANGETSNDLAKERGTALLNIRDENGQMRRTRLEDALFIPSFPQNILSVHAAARKGARIELGLNGGSLVTKNGTVFSIETRNNLYYLNAQD